MGEQVLLEMLWNFDLILGIMLKFIFVIVGLHILLGDFWN